jgi:hypothetical protein
MSLTGIPLLVLALLVTAGSITATVLLWSRAGRWRVAVRTAGILLVEASLVIGVGLIANREEQFYPSWPALAGQTGPSAAPRVQAAGRLDAGLRTSGPATVAWRPPGAARWRLAAGPELVLPAGYRDRPGVTFPVLLDLAGAHGEAGAVTLHLAPTAHSTAESLSSLADDLARDVRVTTRGWAILAPMRDAPFAAALIRSAPGRFTALALVGDGVPPVTGITEAVARDPAARADLPAGVLALRGGWAAAARWAAGQTSAPLAAPVELPVGTRAHRRGRP